MPYRVIRYHIKTPPKTRLRLSADVTSNLTAVQVSNYNEGGTTVDVNVNKSKRETIFGTNEHEKLVVSIYNSKEGMLKAGNIMVGIAGEAKTIFEPYKPAQTLTLVTPNSLPGIKVDSGGNYTDASGQQWVCDEIDLERGKYVQRIGIVNDKISNLNLNLANNSNGTKLFVIADVTTKMKAALMCNMLRYGKTQTDNQVMTTERGNGGKICFTYYKANDIEELKTYIGENVINILYELPEPIEHDLPPEVIEAYKKLHTNYPVTTVLNDAGAGMKVEYVADTKNYTDNKIAESVKNQMQNLTNLLSLMPMETQAAMIENDVNRILESEVTK